MMLRRSDSERRAGPRRHQCLLNIAVIPVIRRKKLEFAANWRFLGRIAFDSTGKNPFYRAPLKRRFTEFVSIQ